MEQNIAILETDNFLASSFFFQYSRFSVERLHKISEVNIVLITLKMCDLQERINMITVNQKFTRMSSY